MRYVIYCERRGYLTLCGEQCERPKSGWYSYELAKAREYKHVNNAFAMRLDDETVHAVLSFDPPVTIPIQK